MTTRREPCLGIGKILSSKRPPRGHSSSAGSCHGPGTQTSSSFGLGCCGAAFWIAPRQIAAAFALSMNSPSTSLPSTSRASRSICAPGGSGKRKMPSSSSFVSFENSSSISVRATLPAMRTFTPCFARRTAWSFSSVRPGRRARSSPRPLAGASVSSLCVEMSCSPNAARCARLFAGATSMRPSFETTPSWPAETCCGAPEEPATSTSPRRTSTFIRSVAAVTASFVPRTRTSPVGVLMSAPGAASTGRRRRGSRRRRA